MEDYNGNFEMVDLQTIVIDHRYQRPEKPALVSAIASDPRWELFGVPILFKRASNNLFYAADGQQRIQGLRMSKNPPKKIPAVWFPVAGGIDEEAAVFVQINEFRKALTAYEKHRGRLVARDPSTLAIEKAVEEAGMSIGKGQSGMARSVDDNTITAVGTLYTIHEQLGEEGLLQTLVVARDAFNGDGNGLSAPVLKAIATLIEELGDGYERQKVTKALSRVSPTQLLRKSEELRIDVGGSRGANMRRAIRVLCKI